jgi:hypothetical protein
MGGALGPWWRSMAVLFSTHTIASTQPSPSPHDPPRAQLATAQWPPSSPRHPEGQFFGGASSQRDPL